MPPAALNRQIKYAHIFSDICPSLRASRGLSILLYGRAVHQVRLPNEKSAGRRTPCHILVCDQAKRGAPLGHEAETVEAENIIAQVEDSGTAAVSGVTVILVSIRPRAV
jgi:hypothetical protein